MRWALMAAVVASGCVSDDGGEPTRRLSIVGESCASTDDCEEGARCLEMVCVAEDAEVWKDPNYQDATRYDVGMATDARVAPTR